jgi:hypothetical protein
MTTVAELIKFLETLPPDLLVVRDSGGDCDGFIDIMSSPEEERSWHKTEELLLAPGMYHTYHGKYDSWEEVMKAARNFTPKGASDQEAMAAFINEMEQQLKFSEDEASKVTEVPEGHARYGWSLDLYISQTFHLVEQREFIEFLKHSTPMKAIVLR